MLLGSCTVESLSLRAEKKEHEMGTQWNVNHSLVTVSNATVQTLSDYSSLSLDAKVPEDLSSLYLNLVNE